jgi:DinB superfamily
VHEPELARHAAGPDRDMNPSAETYADLYTMNFKSVNVLCRDLTEDEARRRPDGRQNPALWMLGHITTYRAELLRMLGAEPSRGKGLAASFGRDVRADEAAWPGVTELLADLAALHSELVERLKSLGEAAFEPTVTTPAGVKMPAVAFLHFHESYHLGQLGYVRTWLGKSALVRPRSANPPA